MGVSGDGEFEDDGNYGSAAAIDVEVLRSISKRVHYGEFVYLLREPGELGTDYGCIYKANSYQNRNLEKIRDRSSLIYSIGT